MIASLSLLGSRQILTSPLGLPTITMLLTQSVGPLNFFYDTYVLHALKFLAEWFTLALWYGSWSVLAWDCILPCGYLVGSRKCTNLLEAFRLLPQKRFFRHLALLYWICLLYTSPSPRDQRGSRMPSSA